MHLCRNDAELIKRTVFFHCSDFLGWNCTVCSYDLSVGFVQMSDSNGHFGISNCPEFCKIGGYSLPKTRNIQLAVSYRALIGVRNVCVVGHCRVDFAFFALSGKRTRAVSCKICPRDVAYLDVAFSRERCYQPHRIFRARKARCGVVLVLAQILI